jgi:hypothetical protein
MFDQLQRAPPSHQMEPVPGWLARRANTAPPAADVMEALPAGPVVMRHQDRAGRERSDIQRLETR